MGLENVNMDASVCPTASNSAAIYGTIAFSASQPFSETWIKHEQDLV